MLMKILLYLLTHCRPKFDTWQKGWERIPISTLLIFDPQVKIGIFLFNDFSNQKFGNFKSYLFNTFILIRMVSHSFPTNNLHTCYKPSPKSWTLACKETNLKPKQLFGSEVYTYTSTVGCNNTSCLAHILGAPTWSLIHAEEIKKRNAKWVSKWTMKCGKHEKY